jgi:glycerate kinase
MALSVVIAPDSFKGSLPAEAAASAIAAGWRELRDGDELLLLPQADGGEGTLDAIAATHSDARRHIARGVTGPDGRPVDAAWLELAGGVAVVELAESSGLPLMAAPDAHGATTRGLGEVIRQVIDSGARAVVIAVGGSASTDGGAGALQALGIRLLQEDGSEVAPGGQGLSRLRTVDVQALAPAPPEGVTVLTDVTAPLLGANGAAAVFGPQKGATPDDVQHLDAALANYASLLGGDPSVPGAGAAGGTAYGFMAVWGATVEPGADWIARVTGMTSALETADVVITGEGRFDSTSLTGKVVGNVIRSAGASRVGIVAGSVAIEHDAWTASLTELAGSVEAAVADPERWLRVAGRNAALHFGSPRT